MNTNILIFQHVLTLSQPMFHNAKAIFHETLAFKI